MVAICMSSAMAGASYGVLSNTHKPFTNFRTKRTSISIEVFPQTPSEVLKRSLGTKYARTMASNHRTLTNSTRKFDAGECKLVFDNQHNGTKDNSDNKENKKTVMLDEREAACRSEDANNLFAYITALIIVTYFYKVDYQVDYQLCEFLFVLH